MENTLVQLIATCVTKNVLFSGLAGASYTVQDLIHSTSRTSLNKMYKRTKKELDSLDTDSLYDTSNTTRKNKLQLEVDTIKAVFEYKTGLEKAAKEKAERAEKLAFLKELKTDKEKEALMSKSIDDIEKEIALLEA